MPISKRWLIATRISPEADQALRSYHPVLRQILFNRGHVTPEAANQYLQALPPPGSDPFTMHGVAVSVERIFQALQRREPVAIYGDYDTDGVTATALLVQTIEALGGQARGYIPNRFDEGYGLNKEALSTLQSDGYTLVITVDCGIRSLDEVAHARQIDLDLIVTDHHQPSDGLPDAFAIINPKQPADTYLDKDLAGVGIAYKLACALLSHAKSLGIQASIQPEMLLDLVALGTVADLAPLTGENRALVRAGLEYLRRPHRQGLRSLMGVADLAPERVTATDIGFVLGPRLNAAGRLESALAAFELLVTRDVQKAGELAQLLHNQNRARQEITREIQTHAEQSALSEDPNPLLLFAAHADYNRGVVGLAASHLTEIYYRPAIVAQIGEESTRGSCRSIPEFHITQALDQCAELLDHHGGHAAAAGFTVRNELLPELIKRLKAIAHDQLASLDLQPTLYADVELPLSSLKPDLLEPLSLMQPTGYGNPQAVFVSRNLKVINARSVGRDNAHLKLTVTDGRIAYDVIAFRQGHWYSHLPTRIDLMYTFETNEYNGRVSLQLNAKDLRASD